MEGAGIGVIIERMVPKDTQAVRSAAWAGQRRPVAAAIAGMGLALLVWFPAWTAGARGGCRATSGVGHIGVASVVIGALMIGTAVGLLAVHRTWQIALVSIAVALPIAVFGLMSWVIIGLDRCWNF